MFVTPYRVRFADVDNAGIFYYPRFFHAFHVAFEEWWERDVGRPYHRILHEDKVGFPAVHIETDFRLPVTFGDPMDIHLAVTRIGKTSVVFRYAFVHRGTGAVHCETHTTKAVVDMDTWRPIRPPPAILAALESILLRTGPRG